MVKKKKGKSKGKKKGKGKKVRLLIKLLERLGRLGMGRYEWIERIERNGR